MCAISGEARETMRNLHSSTEFKVPLAVAARMTTAWAESLEGSLGGIEVWSYLDRYRSRLLLASIPQGVDRNTELKRRLRMWEQGCFDDLVAHVAGQQVEAERRGRGGEAGRETETEEKKGRKARQLTAANAVGKVLKGLVGGVAAGSPEERAQWTADLVPRSETTGDGPCSREAELIAAQECAWGGGDVNLAKREMSEAGRRPGEHPSIPWAKIAPLSAAGPSGDRQEHLDDCLAGAGVSQKRRLTRALDELTVRWATGKLPPTCRWLLNTRVLFLMKEREATSKEFDDNEWLQLPEWMQLVAERDVAEEGPEIEEHAQAFPEEYFSGSGSTRAGQQATDGMDTSDAATARPKVRPIQMGEFLRKWVSRRLLKLNVADIEVVMSAMRQLGVRSQGGAEALAIFQQCVYDLWKSGSLARPLARIKIDEKNCFGMLEWPAVREASMQALPRHAAVACWKHAAVSAVEQQGVADAPKD